MSAKFIGTQIKGNPLRTRCVHDLRWALGRARNLREGTCPLGGNPGRLTQRSRTQSRRIKTTVALASPFLCQPLCIFVFTICVFIIKMYINSVAPSSHTPLSRRCPQCLTRLRAARRDGGISPGQWRILAGIRGAREPQWNKKGRYTGCNCDDQIHNSLSLNVSPPPPQYNKEHGQPKGRAKRRVRQSHNTIRNSAKTRGRAKRSFNEFRAKALLGSRVDWVASGIPGARSKTCANPFQPQTETSTSVKKSSCQILVVARGLLRDSRFKIY